MNENIRTPLANVPIGGMGGLLWNRLHAEREDLCEALLKDGQRVLQNPLKAEGILANANRRLMEARLREIDDALDRLMSRTSR